MEKYQKSLNSNKPLKLLLYIYYVNAIQLAWAKPKCEIGDNNIIKDLSLDVNKCSKYSEVENCTNYVVHSMIRFLVAKNFSVVNIPFNFMNSAGKIYE